eukprot:TRINITY_DN4343_c0_g1_i1.p1 TRINITY_DN4343_c0_g1~~TRINITY_DN4343_c0_g1_i1.p1  ORF type:complete len:181 (-),score=27.64 TRINITY_DN4343_c0_g1_i1:527-1069(-)
MGQKRGTERPDRVVKQPRVSAVARQEIQLIEEKLEKRGLILHEIPSDGHCLYEAISHQLSLNGKSVAMKQLRSTAASYILAHKEDFLPFIAFDGTDIAAYARALERTAAWGGQPEIVALCGALNVRIEVISATADSLFFGQDDAPLTLILVFQQRLHRAGAHYNSVKPAADVVVVATDDC